MTLIAAVRECEACPAGAYAFLDTRVAALIAAGGLAWLTLLIVTAAFLRYHDRPIPGWLIPMSAFAYGVGASLMVLLWPAGTDLDPSRSRVARPSARDRREPMGAPGIPGFGRRDRGGVPGPRPHAKRDR